MSVFQNLIRQFTLETSFNLKCLVKNEKSYQLDFIPNW